MCTPYVLTIPMLGIYSKEIFTHVQKMDLQARLTPCEGQKMYKTGLEHSVMYQDGKLAIED